MEENKTKTKMPKKKKITLIILGVILVVFIAANVYASVNGYGNIFFMIKNLMESQEVSGSENLLSDKEITISYQSIDIADGLKIQINKMVIDESGSTLYVYVNKEDETTERTPLTYKIYNDGSIITEYEGQNSDEAKYTDEIKMEGFNDENATLTLELYDNSNNLLATITIDLPNKQITVNGKAVITKQSEVELKKYLGCFATLNNDNISNKQDKIILTSRQINIKILGAEEEECVNAKTLTNIAQAFYYENVEKEIYNNDEVIKAGDICLYNPESGSEGKETSYTMLNVDLSEEERNLALSYGLALSIEEISFKDGVYTVKFVYCLPTEQEDENGNIENLDQYEATAELTINADTTYSKYKLKSLTAGTKVTSKKEDTVYVEQSLTGNLGETLILYSNGDVKMTFNIEKLEDALGTVNNATEQEIPITGFSGKKISKIYQTTVGTSAKFFLMEDGSVQFLELLPNLYDDYTGGYTIPSSLFGNRLLIARHDIVDIMENNYGVTIAVTKDGEEIECWNETLKEDYNESDNQEEIDFDDTNTTNSNTTSSSSDSTEIEWSNYWAPGIKIDYPSSFEIEEVGENRGESPGECSTIITGNIPITTDNGRTGDARMEIVTYEPSTITREEWYNYYSTMERI